MCGSGSESKIGCVFYSMFSVFALLRLSLLLALFDFFLLEKTAVYVKEDTVDWCKWFCRLVAD